MKVTGFAASAVFTLAVFAGSLLAAEFDTPEARESPLKQTRRGPTYFFMTKQERAALRQRVRKEKWAREFFEQKVLPRASRANPVDTSGNVQNPMLYNAVAYVVTGEQRYAETARNCMMKYVIDWERHEKDKPLKKCNYYWYLNPVDFPRVYDLVADALSSEDEGRIRACMKQRLDKAREWNVKVSGGGNPNMTQCAWAYYGEWACAIGYDSYLDWLFNAPRPVCTHGGIWENLDTTVRDGSLTRESLIYGYVGGGPLTAFADAYKRYSGEDILSRKTKHGGAIRGMIDAALEFAFALENFEGKHDQLPVATHGVAVSSWGWPSWVLAPGAAGSQSARRNVKAAYARIYRRSKEPAWGWVLSLLGERPDFDPGITLGGSTHGGWSRFWDLLYGRLDLEHVGLPPAPCRFYPESGAAILRADQSPKHWDSDGLTIVMRGGEKYRGERANWIMLHGAGRLLYPYDEGQQYSNVRYSIAKNCISIDGREFEFSYSESRRSFEPEVKFMDLRCAPYIEGLTERAVMLTRQYCLDLAMATMADRPLDWPRPQEGFGIYHQRGRLGGCGHNASLSTDRIHVTGVRPINMKRAAMPAGHRIDYALHGYGILHPEAWSLYEPSRELRKTGFGNRWTENERARTNDDEIVVDWVQNSAGRRRKDQVYSHYFDYGAIRRGLRACPEEWFKHKAGVRMRMLGEPGTIVFTGEKPLRPHGPVDRDLWPEEVIPFITLRREGKQALFVALHEPYKPKEAGPQIESFEWIAKPPKDEKTPTVAVKVTAPQYTDRLFVTLGLQGNRAAQRAPWHPPQQAFLKGKRRIADLTKGWLIKADPDKVGEKQRWFNPRFDRTGWKPCDAARDWFGALPDYYGDAWYARAFTIPEKHRAGKLYLWFESADKEAWVWVNGKKLGENHVWNIPFGIDITDVVKPEGENTVVVKIYSYAWGAGLLKPVTLLAANGAYAAAKGEPAVPAPRAPAVTVISQVDARERITFRSHAYMRVAGDSLVVRGDIDSFSVLAPEARTVILNGKPVPLKRSGGYVLLAGATPAEAPSVVIESVSAPRTIIYPGQSLPVKVVVRNASERKKKVRLTLRAEGANASKTQRMKLKPGEAQVCHMTLSAPLTAPVGRKVASRAQAAVGRQLVRSSERILTVASPVAVRLPQKYVNVDAQQGGPLVVRLLNDSPSEVKGRVSLKPAAGLKYAQGWQPFSVPPGSKSDIALTLTPDGVKGKLVPVEVAAEVETAAGRYVAQKVTHNVAVGVVISDYEQPIDPTAISSVDPKSPWAPTSPRPELNFDSYLVRAPGYTIKIDKYSGVSRWIIDPDGKCRTELGWYQEALQRGWVAFRDNVRQSSEVPCVWGKENGERTKVFGWDRNVELVARDMDAETGCPRLVFRPVAEQKVLKVGRGSLPALSGDYELTYVFQPQTICCAAKGENVRVDLGKFNFIDRGYRWEFVKESRGPEGKFGFRLAEPFQCEGLPQKPQARQGNLIQEGDFADLTEEWQVRGPGRKPLPEGAVRLDPEVTVNGKPALRIDVSKAGRFELILKRRLDVRKELRYRFRYWIRSEQVKGPAKATPGWCRYSMLIELRGGKPPSHRLHVTYHPWYWPEGTQDWAPVEVTSRPMPDSCQATVVLLSILGAELTGTVWIGDLTCEEILD